MGATALFGTRLVQCSACPPGWYGSGRAGCFDINECMVLRNGGCDQHSTCTNFEGGSTCSPCEDVTDENGHPLYGDPNRVDGCRRRCNGGCDQHSTCTANVEGNYTCSPCEDAKDEDGHPLVGDPNRLNGCHKRPSAHPDGLKDVVYLGHAAGTCTGCASDPGCEGKVSSEGIPCNCTWKAPDNG